MKYIILIAIILVAIFYMYNVNSCQCSVGSNDNVDVVIRQHNTTANNEKGNGSSKTLILYWATWCHHCETFMKTWNELKAKYSDKIKFVDVEHKKMSQEELAKVGGFPAIFYIDEKGNEKRIKQRNNIPNEIGL